MPRLGGAPLPSLSTLMDLFMSPQVIFPSECFAALLAIVKSNSFVAHHVVVQYKLACEGLST
jgi:hypothetical protein